VYTVCVGVCVCGLLGPSVDLAYIVLFLEVSQDLSALGVRRQPGKQKKLSVLKGSKCPVYTCCI